MSDATQSPENDAPHIPPIGPLTREQIDHITLTASAPATTCNNQGGTGIGAGHSCACVRKVGHPLDSERPHGCPCGAMWSDTRVTPSAKTGGAA